VLAPIVKYVHDTLRARAHEAGASIASDVPEDLAMQGDADAIERILLNLVDNGIRHGGERVAITIRGQRAGDRVALAVSDSGPGVPAEHRAKLFERFHRGGTTAEGSGLGLAIARELASAMGGTLTLTGRSTFTLELPA
jgi:signal transduction histidine kinase